MGSFKIVSGTIVNATAGVATYTFSNVTFSTPPQVFTQTINTNNSYITWGLVWNITTTGFTYRRYFGSFGPGTGIGDTNDSMMFIAIGT